MSHDKGGTQDLARYLKAACNEYVRAHGKVFATGHVTMATVSGHAFTGCSGWSPTTRRSALALHGELPAVDRVRGRDQSRPRRAEADTSGRQDAVTQEVAAVSAHVIRHPIGEPARLNTSRTFPSARAAGREAAAWNDTGGWQARVQAGRAPNASCGRPHCTRLYDHAHDDDQRRRQR